MKNKILYLIRHGETEYNREKRFYGSRDIPINETGRQQAISIAKYMRDYPIEELYTSQLIRSQQTAQLVFPSQKFQALVELNERDFGRWEGLTANEIQATFPSEWEQWLEAPFTITPSEAEPFPLFQNRVWKRIDSLITLPAQSIGIVAHLGVLRLIYQHLVDHQADFWKIDIPQGTVLRVSSDEVGTTTIDYLTGRSDNEE